MKIRLFGTVRLEAENGELHPGPPAQKKLLALLAMRAGYAVSVDRLIEEMWDDEPPANAEQIVRTYVSRLRRVIEPKRSDRDPPSVLVTEPAGYRLVVTERDVDILSFERLVEDGAATGDVRRHLEADRLWTDDPLAEFPYDEFAVRLRDRLEPLRLDALEHRLELEVGLPVSASAVAELGMLVEDHPLRERFWLLLITGLYRSGQQTAALRAYDRCRRALADVGLEPGPELRQIEAAVSRHDAALLTPPTGERSLPAAVDAFVGRVDELAALRARLESGRLATVVGAGGSGKTRLALEVAREWSAGRSFFVDLAPMAAPGAVVEALLDALRVPQRHSTDPLASAVRVLSKGDVLLVVDNCEHVLDEVGPVVERLLVECPTLTVLATSREALRARGEALLAIPPLGLPEVDSSDAVRTSDAGRLFLDRARAVQPGFEIDEANAAAVATILGNVDGIPLAIEMAAIQLQAIDVDGLAASLSDVFTGLGLGRRTALPRHRTLRATLEWSYRLLEESEQRLFRRLGVMAGDFDDDVVLSLGGTVDGLRRLVATSMVARSAPHRYRLLVPVRQFARSLLDESGELDEAEDARNRHYVGVVRELGEGFRRFAEESAQERFAANRLSILTAIDALRESEPEESAALVAVALDYLARLGFYDDAERLGERAVVDASAETLQLELHQSLAHVLSHRGDTDGAEVHLDEALRLSADKGSMAGVARVINLNGNVIAQKGYIHEARVKFAEALRLYEEGAREEWHVPVVNLGWAEAMAGRLDEARGLLARLEDSRQEDQLPQEAAPMADALAGLIAKMAGSPSLADHLFGTAIEGFQRHRSAFHLVLAKVERAIVRYEMGDTAAAERLAGEIASSPVAGEVALRWRFDAGRVLASIAFDTGAPARARSVLRGVYEMAIDAGNIGAVVAIADTAAALAASGGDPGTAGTLLTWADARRDVLGLARDPYETARRAAIVAQPSAPVDLVDDAAATCLLEGVLGVPASVVLDTQRSMGKPTMEPHSVQLPS